MTLNQILTLLVALCGGLIFARRKIPAGAMLGAIVFSAAFNLITGMGDFPSLAKVGVQAVAGGFIGQRISREDVAELRQTIFPSVLLSLGIIVLSFTTGTLMYHLSPLDLNTTLVASIPGGISDMAMISLDLDADPAQTTVLHLVRYIVALMVLPGIAAKVCHRFQPGAETVSEGPPPGYKPPEVQTPRNIAVTTLILAASGAVGKITGLPAGTILFAMIATAAYNIKTGRAYLPLPFRVAAQVCAGAVVGSGIGMDDLLQMRALILPGLMVAANCFVINYGLGLLLYKASGKLNLSTCLYSSIPAGLTDMVLVSTEMGGDAPKVAVLQLVRYLSVMGIMPTLIRLFSAVYPW